MKPIFGKFWRRKTYVTLYDHLMGSSSGQYVSSETAKRIATVYSCCNVLGQTIGALPLKVYEKQSDGTRKQRSDYPLQQTILKPNPMDNQYNFMERVVWDLSLRGRAFAFKNKFAGNVEELLPVSPDDVQVTENEDWTYTFTYNGEKYSLDDMLYIKMHDGRSIIQYQRDTIGFAQALFTYSAGFFKNGARPAAVITSEKTMDDEAMKRFKKSWEAIYGGSENSGQMAILDQGKKIQTLSMSNVDAQYLDTAKYSDTQICGLFRIPPHLIAILDHATFSNVEELGLQFSEYTCEPWCKNIEQSISLQCIPEKERGRIYCEFNMDSLARGSLQTRYNAYYVGRNAGFLSRNDIRDKENMNRIPGGDDYLTPANYNTLGKENVNAKK